MIASLAQATDNVSASAGAGVQGSAEAIVINKPGDTLWTTRSVFEESVALKLPPPPERVKFNGGIAGDWLMVERHNMKAHDAKGFDPCYTSVISDFKPVPKKRSDGKWEIEFVTDLPQ